MTAAGVLGAGVWQVDLTRSTASFVVGNLGRKARGTVPVTGGTVEVGADGALLAVHGTLDLGSIDTGIAKRDLDLRKPGLLDLDRHPAMTFTATSASPVAGGVGGHRDAHRSRDFDGAQRDRSAVHPGG
ncbi:YceI family protein [Lentzea sp. NPDC004782]|uniref:YceI family protein n=1 Tax=Lentzea sp. NPDC004782 TaxID=3154458 RepID=UPI0033B17CEA